MSSQFGYNQQFTDKPGMWDADGYCVANSAATSSDGYLVVQSVVLTTTGSLSTVNSNAPSSVVQNFTRTSTGIYVLHLNQPFVQITHASFIPVCNGGTKLVAVVQSATSQTVTFNVVTLNGSATLTDIGDTQGLFFRVRLKQSSA